MSGLVIVGAGGHAKVVIAIARSFGFEVEAAYDDDESKWGTYLMGVPVKGPIAAVAGSGHAAVLAIGDNRKRKELAEGLGLDFRSLVHPRAWVEPTAKVGVGTVVGAGAVIGVDVRIGAQVIVGQGATVDHDVVIEDYVHLGPGTHLSPMVKVGAGAWLQVGVSAAVGAKVRGWEVYSLD